MDNGVENYESVLAHGLVSQTDRQVEEMLPLRGIMIDDKVQTCG